MLAGKREEILDHGGPGLAGTDRAQEDPPHFDRPLGFGGDALHHRGAEPFHYVQAKMDRPVLSRHLPDVERRGHLIGRHSSPLPVVLHQKTLR